ncbi:MAG: RNA polymerase sigma factor WhiG [Spirochaetaceae bacterium]|jgi:RNA polymerase sigma factor for flagellar operon FliA|nr:RNA polymerase sigma factor WhiG [Spirochaetaceae bacterium]
MGKVPWQKSDDNSLTQKPEDERWIDYRRTRDPKIREDFIKQYAPLVKYVAGRLAVGMPHNVEFDDLVGFGAFGLLDAIDKFDPSKNVKFKTYAVTRIRGAIFDELRAIDWVPRSIRQKTREVEETIGSLEAKLGRPATDQEIAGSLGMNEDEYLKTMMKISGTAILSINDMWYTGDENDRVSIMDSIESPSSLNPEVMAEKDEIRRVIADAISELPDKEKKILVLYYFEDLTLKEIGEVLGVTESRVSQLHTQAILRLRARLKNTRNGIV